MFGIGKKELCGLQLLDDRLRLAALRPSGKGPALKLHHEEPLAAGAVQNGKILREDEVAATLEGAVRRLGLTGRGIYLSVPASGTVLRKTVFPAVGDRELRNLIDVELNGGAHMPFKDPVFDFVRLDGTGAGAGKGGRRESGDEERGPVGSEGAEAASGQQEVLIFASPAGIVDSYVRVARQAGLKPLSVELSSLASLRLLLQDAGRRHERLPDCFMIVHAEASQLEFSICSRGVPVFLHSVAEMAAGADYARTVSAEIGRILYYFNSALSGGRDEIQTIYVHGSEDRLRGLPQIAAGAFDGPIRPLSLESWAKDADDSLGCYAIPLGLALKGA